MFGYEIETLKTSWGVYAIVNKVSERKYIGSTADSFFKRWKVHLYSLNSGKHACLLLQRDWTLLGPDAFTFQVLEAYTDPRRSFLDSYPTWARHREAVLLAQAGNVYNVALPHPSTLSGEHARRHTPELWRRFYGDP